MTAEAPSRTTPFVTVVVPTRNRAGLLGAALESLVEQDYPPERFEVVVVDDGSSDGTPGIARRFATQMAGPNLRLLRQPPTNVNVARNRGVADAEGSVLAFFDDDELAPAGWLSALVDAANRHPEADCFGGPYRLRFEGRRPRVCRACLPLEGAVDQGDKERSVRWVASGNMMVRRRAFDRAGLFDESMSGRHYNEIEWMHRYASVGGRTVYVPTAWIVHRRTPEMLRLGTRLWKAFSGGQREVWFRMKIGQPVRGMRRLAGIPRLIAHGVTRGCSGGLMQAATSMGYAMEAFRTRSSRVGAR